MTLIRVGAIVACAAILSLAARALSDRVRLRLLAEGGEDSHARKRATTLTGIVRVACVAIVWVTAFVMVLSEAGIAVGPVLAAAGVGGIAIGFGAQSLVRDVIAGFFILMENQFDVGDVAEVAGVSGAVESISLRTTVLRGLDGTRHVVPNGEIRVSSNLTKGYSRYVVDVPLPYDTEVDEVVAVARRVAEEMRWEPAWARAITAPLEVLGVEDYADRGAMLRMYVQTLPGHQWGVGREFRARLQRALREQGLEIAQGLAAVVSPT